MAVEELKIEFEPFCAFTTLSPEVAAPPAPTVTA
jgi:hypothetical protein